MTDQQLADEILRHLPRRAAELASARIAARIAELQPLVAFSGALGAVYAAEIVGLQYALELLQDLEDV